MLEQINKQFQKLNIIHILLISFSLHMLVIQFPNLPILDENFFIGFARLFMEGIDHTPYQLNGLSVIVSPFVYLFGDNWFSWRFPIIIFGMIFLYFYYKVIEQTVNKKTALLSTIIISLSPLIFVHSSLMLRDIPVMALGFMAIYLYFKQRYYFVALIIGLSALIKETAIFFLIFITIYHVTTHREKIIMQISSSIDKKYFGFIKTPLFTILILSASFLIPLTIYDNTITVLEYRTNFPEYLIYGDPQFKSQMFLPSKITPEIIEKSVSEFNYISIVKDPIHHLNLYITKGYFSYNFEMEEKNAFMASFLPIEQKSKNIDIKINKEKTITQNGVEKHVTDFDLLWTQSMINYSYWHVSFWGIILMVSYTLYNKIKYQKTIPKQHLILIASGFAFFAPYLIIDLIRNTFAYFLIYYVPFLSLGLVLLIHKIRNKKIQTIVLCSFLMAIFANFVYYFPVKFFE